ncbi:MAG TPA: VWA domain-containing protein [Gaiellaceae bacterium]|nr:VWA domain-containing protein [Gaiellaceae bacterium]
MILAVACVLSVLVAAAAVVFAPRRAQAQLLPVDAGREHGFARQRRVPGRVLYLGAAAAVVAACGLLAWTVDGGTSGPPALPGETVLVIDLSGSITTQGDLMIARTLDGFHDYPPDRRAAVVYFSSSAALASPPSSPAADLSGLSRFFAPTTSRMRGPWAGSFDGGTVISRAIALATRVLKNAQARHGRVILLSDLQDNPKDLPRLHDQLALLQQAGAQFELLPLPPTRGSPISLAQLSAPYRAVFGDHIILLKPFLVAGTNGRPVTNTAILHARYPTVALLLALILAASALFVSYFPRLAWRLG